MAEPLLDQARNLSWNRHGRRIGFYIPGMFVYEGKRGRFPALSLTGAECGLNCPHCESRLLQPMIPAQDPAALIEAARQVKAQGGLGLLVSGGLDKSGRLPWERFLEALARIKAETGLYLSVHAGFPDLAQARALKAAGVDLAMFDVVGDEETLKRVYGLEGRDRVARSLQALVDSGLRVSPHVVVGLLAGRIQAEARAVDLIARAGLDQVVFVVLKPLKGTAFAAVTPPRPAEVVELMVQTRLDHPHIVQHLGCARPPGAYRREIDRLAVLAGVNHLALPAPEAVDLAKDMGLAVSWSETCCAPQGEITDGKS